MKPSARAARFITIGWLGFGVQAATLACLTAEGWSWLPATIAAVEAAVVHNYVWHSRWTWRDRTPAPSSACARFLRYNAVTGLISILGNVLLTGAFLAVLPLNPVAANLVAVVALTMANFLAADRWIFRAPSVTAAAAGIAAVLAFPAIASAQPSVETVRAWDRYIAAAEARIDRDCDLLRASDEIDGDTIAVDGGTIHHWRGTVFISGITVERLLGELLNPAPDGARQEDVADSRTIARNGDTVRTYIRLVRRAIVTVEYDTENEMTFRRSSPVLATARSAATSIREDGGDDHGLLWRLNSYWKYRQVASGTVVELESMTLSRSIPMVVRPIAMPIIRHVARESMARTLDAFRRRFRG
jgi:putative flippase GtrA